MENQFLHQELWYCCQSVDISADNLCEEISGLTYNITKHSALWRINFFIKNVGIAATEC